MNRPHLTILISLLFCTVAQAQSPIELTRKNGRICAFSQMTPERIARQLTQNETDDSVKLAKIAAWIVHHIRYDVKQLLDGPPILQTPRETLLRRKGVCRDYALLAQEMCHHAGIQCIFVNGYDKGMHWYPDYVFRWENHAWNAALINGKWVLMDLTWAAGYVEMKPPRGYLFTHILRGRPYGYTRPKFKKAVNEAYFRTPPIEFVRDHLPADPTFQLLDYPVSVPTFSLINSDGPSPEDSARYPGGYPWANRLAKYGQMTTEGRLFARRRQVKNSIP